MAEEHQAHGTVAGLRIDTRVAEEAEDVCHAPAPPRPGAPEPSFAEERPTSVWRSSLLWAAKPALLLASAWVLATAFGGTLTGLPASVSAGVGNATAGFCPA